MSKYGDDIRKIARYRRTSEGTDKTQEKDVLSARRGVAYPTANGIKTFGSTPGTNTIVNLASEIAGDIVADASTDLLKKAFQQQYGLTEGQEDLENSPEGLFTSSGQGVYAAEDIIDNAAEAAKNGLTPLNGISGTTDQATGDDLNIRLDGNVTLPDDYTIKGTDNTGAVSDVTISWEDINNPPLDPTWHTGQLWYMYGGGNTTLGESFYTMINNLKADGKWAYEYSGGVISALTPTIGVDILVSTPGKNIGDTGGTVHAYDTNLTSNTFTNGYGPRTCGTVTGDTATCALDQPTLDEFPSSHTTDLYLDVDGLIKSSAFNLTQVGKAYRDGVSTLVVDFASGSRKMVIEPGIDNTRLIYEVDANGAVTSDVRQYTVGQIKMALPGSTAYGWEIVQRRVLVNKVPAADVATLRANPDNIIRVKAFEIK
jgi:hypothetical protein